MADINIAITKEEIKESDIPQFNDQNKFKEPANPNTRSIVLGLLNSDHFIAVDASGHAISIVWQINGNNLK